MNLERRPDDLPERGESDKVLARLGVMYSGVVTIACLGALSFYGSGGAVGAIGGGAVDGAGPTAGGTAPDAPTVSAVAVTDTSFYLLGSTYSGDGTHSNSLYVVDTVGGNWTTTDTLGLQAGPDSLTRTDTIFNGDLNNIALATAGSAVLIGRAQYANQFGTSAFGATDTFTVSPGATPDVQVLWSSGTGASSAAVLDSSGANVLQFIGFGDSAGTHIAVTDTLSDVPAAWPANLVEIFLDGEVSTLIGWTDGNAPWSTPAVGEYIYYRMLLYNNTGPNVAFDHGIQSVHNSIIQHCWQLFSPSGGTFNLGFCSALSGGSTIDFATGLPGATALRLEWAFERTGTTTASVHGVRVYVASNDSLIAEATDFCDNYGENCTDTVDDWALTGVDVSAFYGAYSFGSSGPSGSTANTRGLYIGAFGVKVSGNSNAWLGAYN